MKDRSVWRLAAIRAQIMCLKGLSRVPGVTVGLGIEYAWDGPLDSARKHHWVRGLSPHPHPPHPPPFPPRRCGLPFALPRQGNGQAPAPSWWALANGWFFESRQARLRRVFLTPLQLALARHSSGCPTLLSCPHDGAPGGWNVCHFFYFQIKVDDLPIKK